MNMAQLLWLTKMLIINCPYCGEREQEEFSCGGEAHIERPKNPPELMMINGLIIYSFAKILKDYNMKDGITLLVADNGLM